MAVGGEVNVAISLVNGRDVDLGVELHLRCLSRVVFTAYDAEEVDAAIESGTRGSYNSAVPVGEGLIVRVVKTVRA